MATHQLRAEIEANYGNFSAQWPQELETARNDLTGHAQFVESYVRITSIQAWRTSIIRALLDEDSEAFFFEAQNDLLVSHCLAASGSFRQALKSLRSAIENVYFCLYYKDHPIELEKWTHGRHKLGFSELTTYFEAHPKILGKELAIAALGDLSGEYSTLSRAVHGSAKTFRMTQNLEDVRLWVSDPPSVGRWATRERTVLRALNVLLLHLFADSMRGAAHRALRETVGLVIPKSKHGDIRVALDVKLL